MVVRCFPDRKGNTIVPDHRRRENNFKLEKYDLTVSLRERERESKILCI